MIGIHLKVISETQVSVNLISFNIIDKKFKMTLFRLSNFSIE